MSENTGRWTLNAKNCTPALELGVTRYLAPAARAAAVFGVNVGLWDSRK
jgi:hypothetical protein